MARGKSGAQSRSKAHSRAASASAPQSRHQLRIIGGQWRGRRFGFSPQPGLRPTGDRIRETLFNWLGNDLPHARCADLFAGSGALGLEALSRGAAHCDFVDSEARNLRAIEDILSAVDGRTQATCHCTTAARFLERPPREPWDIVFLDPPFGESLLAPTIALLGSGGYLSANALVYVELAKHEEFPSMPEGWTVHRDKQAGDVRYALLEAGERL